MISTPVSRNSSSLTLEFIRAARTQDSVSLRALRDTFSLNGPATLHKYGNQGGDRRRYTNSLAVRVKMAIAYKVHDSIAKEVVSESPMLV